MMPPFSRVTRDRQKQRPDRGTRMQSTQKSGFNSNVKRRREEGWEEGERNEGHKKRERQKGSRNLPDRDYITKMTL